MQWPLSTLHYMSTSFCPGVIFYVWVWFTLACSRASLSPWASAPCCPVISGHSTCSDHGRRERSLKFCISFHRSIWPLYSSIIWPCLFHQKNVYSTVLKTSSHIITDIISKDTTLRYKTLSKNVHSFTTGVMDRKRSKLFNTWKHLAKVVEIQMKKKNQYLLA